MDDIVFDDIGLENNEVKLKKDYEDSKTDIHGYLEYRLGGYTQGYDYASINEARLQLAFSHRFSDVTNFVFRSDAVHDEVENDSYIEVRELYINTSLSESTQAKLGRQIITWGMADFVYVNDLFAKDYLASFIGRDVDSEYSRKPNDALRLTQYWGEDNSLEVVGVARLEPDGIVTSDRHTPIQENLSTYPKAEDIGDFEKPFYALRYLGSILGQEVGLYHYNGYWPTPQGIDLSIPQTYYPKLRTYGASIRGNLAKGIYFAEAAYYDSVEDRDGDNPLIANSQVRWYAGYEQEIFKSMTGSIQYYQEIRLNQTAYEKAQKSINQEVRDKIYQTLTLRFNNYFYKQTFGMTTLLHGSLNEKDAYLRVGLFYKGSDRWMLQGGVNVFRGEDPSTQIGMLEDLSNVYAAVRVNF